MSKSRHVHLFFAALLVVGAVFFERTVAAAPTAPEDPCADQAGWQRLSVPETPAWQGSQFGISAVVGSLERNGVLFAVGDLDAYTSDDCGHNWRPLQLTKDHLPGHPEIGDFRPRISGRALAIGRGDYIYVGGEFRLWVSPDGGTTWNHDVPVIGKPWSLAAAPSNPKIAYALTPTVRNSFFDALSRTVDGGITWQSKALDIMAGSLTVDPLDANTLYLMSRDGFAWRVDGTTGTRVALALPESHVGYGTDTGVTALALSPDGSHLWAIVRPSLRLWLSRDRGITWNLVLVPTGPQEAHRLTVSPFDPRRLFLLDRQSGLWTIQINESGVGSPPRLDQGEDAAPAQLP